VHLVCNITQSSCSLTGQPVCPWWQMDTVSYTIVVKNVDLRSQKLFQLIAINRNNIHVIHHWCLLTAGSTMTKPTWMTAICCSRFLLLLPFTFKSTLHAFFLKVLLIMKSIYVQAGYNSIWVEREVFWKMWNVLLCANINVTCKNADSLEVPITTQFRKWLRHSVV